jgi:hypothetical protein
MTKRSCCCCCCCFLLKFNQSNSLFLIVCLLILIVPGEPRDFKPTKVTSNTIELEWKPPKRDDYDQKQSNTNNIKGYEIHYYKVDPSSAVNTMHSGSSAQDQFKPVDDADVIKRKTNDIKKLKYVLTDLEPNSMYRIQIYAYNMKGDGQRSVPILVTTLDDGPDKPEDIRSEIYKDVLQILWKAPSKTPNSGIRQPVSGYRLYFDKEQHDVDANTNNFTIYRPKWGKFSYRFLLVLKFSINFNFANKIEYDRHYEFRIAAKSIQSPQILGQEALVRISTFTSMFSFKLFFFFEKSKFS